MPNNVKVTINQAGLRREIKSQLHKDKKLNATLRKRIEKNFEKIKKDFINEFLGHDVTKQLMRMNSDTLFPFIGFSAGEDPIAPLERILRERIFMQYKGFNSRGSAKITVNFPSEEELTQASPMPWAQGLSWAKGIESGIPDLGKYLHKPGIPASRSGGGIQIKHEMNSRRFEGRPYLFAMLSKYRNKFTKAGFLVK